MYLGTKITMTIFNLFSKRQKQLRGEVAEVYIYNLIPKPLRVQIIHIWHDSLGDKTDYHRKPNVKVIYKKIVETLCREYGVFQLTDRIYNDEYHNRSYIQELSNFFLQEKTAEKVLDVIELSFYCIGTITREQDYRHINNSSEIADNSIAELNTRFKEHGIGYQFEDEKIIRVDSQFLHTEAVKPALVLLNRKEYAGAQQEFLSAYEHYRHGKQKETLNDALKSFESTMKTICDKQGWTYDSKDTSKRLIEICYQNGLVPTFWQQHMSALRSLLEGGVPTGRNKLSGHGQGATPTTVPEYIVSYVLHMTAAAIVFLVRAEQDIK